MTQELFDTTNDTEVFADADHVSQAPSAIPKRSPVTFASTPLSYVRTLIGFSLWARRTQMTFHKERFCRVGTFASAPRPPAS